MKYHIFCRDNVKDLSVYIDFTKDCQRCRKTYGNRGEEGAVKSAGNLHGDRSYGSHSVLHVAFNTCDLPESEVTLENYGKKVS